ncbi:Cytochrome P450 93A3 [Linum perenne]
MSSPEPTSQFYALLLLSITITTTLIILIIKTLAGDGGGPHLPTPMSLPIIGHLHLLSPIPHQALYNLSLLHGPLFRISLGSVPCVVASSPETAREFLKTHDSSFSDKPVSSAVDYLTYGSSDFAFAPHGPYWKFMKRLCMSELLGGRVLDRTVPLRRDEIRRFVEGIWKSAEAKEPVEVGGELIRLTNNVVSRMVMSERCSGGGDKEVGEVRRVIEETGRLAGEFNIGDFVWWLKWLDLNGFGKRMKVVRERFDLMMERIITEHEEDAMRRMRKKKISSMGEDDGQVKDLLDLLLDISADETSDIKLTRHNIKAFILDIFAAGTETSAITTDWAMAELLNNVEILHKLQEELDSVVGKSRLVEESDITNLPYLQAVVKETLRLHPTGPLIVRQSSEDCEVVGYKIPARTRLFVNVWAIGRDPSHWDDPLEFKPERFMEVKGQHFELLPFGSGRRGCPGITLALQMVHTSLAVMVQCFDWKVESDKGIDMEEGVGLALPRANPLVCVPVARLHPFPFSTVIT